MYGLLADAIVVLHLLFILFVIFGGLFTIRWQWLAWIHIPAMLWGAATEFFHLVCPLTPLENSLRAKSGAGGYSGDFVSQYLVPVIYPEQLTDSVQWLLGGTLVVFNVAVYSLLWRRAVYRSKVHDEIQRP